MTTLFVKRKKGRRDPPDALYLAEIELPTKGRKLITDNHRDAPKGFAFRVHANSSKAMVATGS